MKIPIKMNISYLQAGLSLLIILALAVFCQLANFSLIIPLLLLFLGLHLFFIKKASIKVFLRLGLLLTLLAFTTHAFREYTTISPLYIPVASVAMLTMLLFNDLELGFLVAFITSIVTALLLSGDATISKLFLNQLDVMTIFFVGGLTGVYTVHEARTRGKLMGAGVLVSLIQVVCMVLLHQDMNFLMSKGYFLFYIRPVLVNGILASFVVVATLKIFEYLFGVLTNYSLLELSDFNQPLLKRMILEAPGTYHHSLLVSNIGEAAADSIGANALLTRVGAYYHDIGKMVKPEYYTENQLVGANAHDNIEPSISRLVILNHVKEGIETARKYKLNPIIADFIPQHHGTSLMYFFYQKALEEAEDEGAIKEENYRYPGPKPQSRETAIVLLADSVEAATRSIGEPNPQKIEEVVRKIINNKFIDGQLDECNLTLKEIDTIATTFTRVLAAMYHSRIKYPEKKNGANN